MCTRNAGGKVPWRCGSCLTRSVSRCDAAQSMPTTAAGSRRGRSATMVAADARRWWRERAAEPGGPDGEDERDESPLPLRVRRPGRVVVDRDACGEQEPFHLNRAGDRLSVRRRAGDHRFSWDTSLQPETLISLVVDIGCSLARHGLHRLVILNGHRDLSHMKALDEACARAYRRKKGTDSLSRVHQRSECDGGLLSRGRA